MQDGLPPNSLEVRRKGGLLGPGTLAPLLCWGQGGETVRGRRGVVMEMGCLIGGAFSSLLLGPLWGAVLAQMKGASVTMRSNHSCRRPAPPPGKAAPSKEHSPSHHRDRSPLMSCCPVWTSLQQKREGEVQAPKSSLPWPRGGRHSNKTSQCPN